MIGAYNCCDYYFINHNQKKVCFNFESKKRKKGKVKRKVIRFIKENHGSDIIEYLNSLDLKLELINDSKRYIVYNVIDK